MPIQYRLVAGTFGNRETIRRDHSAREMVESLKGGCAADLDRLRQRIGLGFVWWIEATGIKSEADHAYIVTGKVTRMIGTTFGI